MRNESAEKEEDSMHRNILSLLRNVFTRVISSLPWSSHIYQGHLVDVESDPGKVAEKDEKGRWPSEPPMSIAFGKD